MRQITRRTLLCALPGLGVAARGFAQASKPPIAARKLNHFTLQVSDVKRSREFYQGLFGLALQASQGTGATLQIGGGPHHIGLGAAAANTKPGINHFCLTVDGFKVDAILRSLAGHGVTKVDDAGTDPLKAWVRVRREESGGSKEGTPELYFTDPAGIRVQLQDTSYCGGAGALGNECSSKPTPAPRKGLIAVRELSHVTLGVPDRTRSIAFYQEVFGMRTQAHQGATPILAVGAGPQFVTIAGGAANGAAGSAANIAHGCLLMEDFHPDRVMKALADFGVKPRGDATGPPGALVAWVRIRREDNGGAKEGTPELYFTDPDGITMQLQDVRYCGGAGPLGEVCTG
jgi:catechol 2,3-dioxygenase-like lactoylglutathione lyase family enzyme